MARFWRNEAKRRHNPVQLKGMSTNISHLYTGTRLPLYVLSEGLREWIQCNIISLRLPFLTIFFFFLAFSLPFRPSIMVLCEKGTSSL